MRFLQILATLICLLVAAPAWAGVNVNSATQGELETLPGIGPSKASAILEYRAANGPFTSLADLDNVPGIGPATLQNIAASVEFGEEGEAAASGREHTEPSVEAPKSTGGVNINSASASQLESLPGIGPAKASAILADRDENGPFGSCQDLTRVNGIGDATVRNMGSACSVE